VGGASHEVRHAQLVHMDSTAQCHDVALPCDVITMQDWWRDVTDVVWKLDRCIQPTGWRNVTSSVVRLGWRSSPSSSKVISSATMQNLKILDHLQGDPCRWITFSEYTFTEYICTDEFLGALFHLNRHFRRNSHGTHSKWVYDKKDYIWYKDMCTWYFMGNKICWFVDK
jgi:hypothetical protein